MKELGSPAGFASTFALQWSCSFGPFSTMLAMVPLHQRRFLLHMAGEGWHVRGYLRGKLRFYRQLTRADGCAEK